MAEPAVRDGAQDARVFKAGRDDGLQRPVVLHAHQVGVGDDLRTSARAHASATALMRACALPACLVSYLPVQRSPKAHTGLSWVQAEWQAETASPEIVYFFAQC